MSQKHSILGGNPLLRRVRRYSSMPTLYRAPEPAASDLPRGITLGPSPTMDSAPSSKPVVARLFLPSSAEGQQPVVPAPPAPGTIARAPSGPVSRPAVQPAPPPIPEGKVAPQSRPPEAGEIVQGKPAEPPAAPETPAQQPPAKEDESWDWMDDNEWNRLKRFMAGHQESVAEERARQAEIQRSPEEIQRAEARRQAETELARRQELARKGQLPRAQVVYLSPEEQAAGAAPRTDLPLPLMDEAEFEEGQAAPAPDSVAGEAPPTAVQSAADAGPEARDVEEPLVQDMSAAAAGSKTSSQAGQPESPERPSPDEPPGVAQRLLNAARSLFRRPEGDETPPASARIESESASPDLPQASASTLLPETPSSEMASPGSPSVETSATRMPSVRREPSPEIVPSEPAQERSFPPDAPAAGPELDGLAESGQHEPGTRPPTPQRQSVQTGSVQRDLLDPSITTGAEEQTASEAAALDEPAVRPDAGEEQAPSGAALVEPAASDDDQDTLIAPVPLQQAWPVDEKPAPAETPDRPATERKPDKPPVQRKAAGGDSVGEEVHSTLRDVAPAQVTDSSIELVTPRRPRPAAPAPDVRRQEEQPPTTPPEDQLSRTPAEAAPAERTPGRTHMVSTEIGELPSDLWHLLGEQPPSARAHRTAMPEAAASIQRDVTTAASTAGAEAPSAAQVALQEPSRLLTQQFAPPVLQRVESESPTAGDAAERATPDATGQERAEEGQEVDIDELARKVLPEVKRRLAIDWERGRGRIR